MYGSGTNFLIDQQVRRYRADLQSWVQSVRAARTPRDAFSFASRRPNASGMISSLGSLWNSDKTRASSDVERILEGHVEKSTFTKAEVVDLLRLAQGHWPRIYRSLEAKLKDAV